MQTFVQRNIHFRARLKIWIDLDPALVYECHAPGTPIAFALEPDTPHGITRTAS